MATKKIYTKYNDKPQTNHDIKHYANNAESDERSQTENSTYSSLMQD